ncbi:MAG TPA: hypothetical protein VFC06_06500 [Demequina sp.]|nr:hypothetical protein [Demequina sp.]
MTRPKRYNAATLPGFEAAALLLRDEPGLGRLELSRRLNVAPATAINWLGGPLVQFAVGSDRTGTTRSSVFSDEDVLAALRAAAADIPPGTGLSVGHYNAARRRLEDGDIEFPSTALIVQRFSTWRAALTLAGVATNRSNRSEYVRRWSEDEMTLAVADSIIATGTSAYEAYREWARGADAPQQVRISSERSWNGLVEAAYREFADGGRRRTQYQKRLRGLVAARRDELEGVDNMQHGNTPTAEGAQR